MTQRTSLVGGIISFAAVILLFFLSQDMVEGRGLIQRIFLPVLEDSIEASGDPDTLPPVLIPR